MNIQKPHPFEIVNKYNEAFIRVSASMLGATSVLAFGVTFGDAESPIAEPPAAARGHRQREPVLSKIPSIISVYQNDQNGYPIGNLIDGDSIQDSGVRFIDNRGRTWLAGMMIHRRRPSDNECGWMLASKAAALKKIPAKNICSTQLPRLKNRSNILSESNGKPHQFGGGSLTTVPLRKICQKDSLYLNYDDEKQAAYDRLPVVTTRGLHWRTKTTDRRKIFGQINLGKVASNKPSKYRIWVNVSAGCAIGKLPRDGPPNVDYLQSGKQ